MATNHQSARGITGLQKITDSRIESREIRAGFDDVGVYVYQAFKAETARKAVELGRFGDGFRFDRYTWIKPSFAWVLYRSNYATKLGQERILRIKINHDNFRKILSNATPAIYDPIIFKTIEDWKNSCKNADIRYQWDPERDLCLNKIKGVRTIQLGIGPSHIRHYVNEWIMEISDVTTSVKALRALAGKDRLAANPFPERVYEVSHLLLKF